ncbi:MAG: DNA glycosylase AlkZ-like family protein, partial [Promethearchaeota archaeon]
DIAWWFKQTKTTVKNTIEQMKEDVVTLELDGTEKFMMTADLETASSIEVPTDDNVWFLPYEDHFLKAFIDRSRFISAEIQHRISPPDRRHFWPSQPDEPRVIPSPGVRATGEVRPTIWYNGNVVGRWEIDDIGKEKRIVTSLYTKLDKLGIESIEEKRMDLDCFVNSILLPISGGK